MQPAIGVSAVSWAASLAGVPTRQEAAALASSGERLPGQAPAGKSVLEVAGGGDDVFLVDGGGHELRAVEPHDGLSVVAVGPEGVEGSIRAHGYVRVVTEEAVNRPGIRRGSNP